MRELSSLRFFIVLALLLSVTPLCAEEARPEAAPPKGAVAG
jgi:hypothetical protein